MKHYVIRSEDFQETSTADAAAEARLRSLEDGEARGSCHSVTR